MSKIVLLKRRPKVTTLTAYLAHINQIPRVDVLDIDLHESAVSVSDHQGNKHTIALTVSLTHQLSGVAKDMSAVLTNIDPGKICLIPEKDLSGFYLWKAYSSSNCPIPRVLFTPSLFKR